MRSEFDLDWEDVGTTDRPLRRNVIPAKSDVPRGTIVCVPGFSASGRSFARLSPLSDEYDLHFVAPPLETSYPGDAVISQAEVIADYLSAFATPILLGTSFGGLVSLRAATMQGPGIGGLIMIGAFARGTGLFPKGLAVMKSVLPMMQIAAAPLAPVTARVVGGHNLDRAGTLAIVEDTRAIEARERARRLRAIFRTDLTPLLCEIEAPSLVIHGTADRLVPIHLAREMATALPDSTYHEIVGCGHLPYVTHADEVNAVVRRFLAKVPRAQAAKRNHDASARELRT